MARDKRTTTRRLRDRGHRPETLYVESSALLRVFLEGDAEIEETLATFAHYFTSALTLVEVPRALARARREARMTPALSESVHRRFAAFVRGSTIAEITPNVRERAALDFPLEPVRSLDAIHLATLVVWSDTVKGMVVASCDDRVGRNARALGYEVIPQPTGHV